jgi:hypothetical protein
MAFIVRSGNSSYALGNTLAMVITEVQGDCEHSCSALCKPLAVVGSPLTADVERRLEDSCSRLLFNRSCAPNGNRSSGT